MKNLGSRLLSKRFNILTLFFSSIAGLNLVGLAAYFSTTTLDIHNGPIWFSSQSNVDKVLFVIGYLFSILILFCIIYFYSSVRTTPLNYSRSSLMTKDHLGRFFLTYAALCALGTKKIPQLLGEVILHCFSAFSSILLLDSMKYLWKTALNGDKDNVINNINLNELFFIANIIILSTFVFFIILRAIEIMRR